MEHCKVIHAPVSNFNCFELRHCINFFFLFQKQQHVLSSSSTSAFSEAHFEIIGFFQKLLGLFNEAVFIQGLPLRIAWGHSDDKRSFFVALATVKQRSENDWKKVKSDSIIARR